MLRHVAMLPRVGHRGCIETRSIGIYVAKAARAADHIRYAFFDGAILAIPFYITATDLDDGAPRSVAMSMTYGSIKHHRRRQGRGRDDRLGEGFHCHHIGCSASSGHASSDWSINAAASGSAIRP